MSIMRKEQSAGKSLVATNLYGPCYINTANLLSPEKPEEQWIARNTQGQIIGTILLRQKLVCLVFVRLGARVVQSEHP